MSNDPGAHSAHEGKTGTVKSAKVLTWKKWKMVLHPVSTRIKPTAAVFTGSPHSTLIRATSGKVIDHLFLH